jgi:RNA polymerase sigma factor (sigma-70 family)
VAEGDDVSDAEDAAVVAASSREPELFAAVYDTYFAEIYRYLAGRLGPDAAADLAAETFLAAFRARDRFDPVRGAVRPWLYGIASNLAGTHLRAEVRHYRALTRIGHTPDTSGHEDQVTARVSAQQQRAFLAEALAGLSAGDREVLLLVAVAGLSYQEIAAALSIPPGTVGSRLARARKKVKEALGSAQSPLTHD